MMESLFIVVTSMHMGLSKCVVSDLKPHSWSASFTGTCLIFQFCAGISNIAVVNYILFVNFVIPDILLIFNYFCLDNLRITVKTVFNCSFSYKQLSAQRNCLLYPK